MSDALYKYAAGIHNLLPQLSAREKMCVRLVCLDCYHIYNQSRYYPLQELKDNWFEIEQSIPEYVGVTFCPTCCDLLSRKYGMIVARRMARARFPVSLGVTLCSDYRGEHYRPTKVFEKI